MYELNSAMSFRSFARFLVLGSKRGKAIHKPLANDLATPTFLQMYLSQASAIGVEAVLRRIEYQTTKLSSVLRAHYKQYQVWLDPALIISTFENWSPDSFVSSVT